MPDSPSFYDLLPEFYRRRDREAGFALEAFLDVLEGPRALIEENIAALYRSWFVETCEDWALPYMARLAGCDGPPEHAADRRALVADAIAFARRKGTRPALEHELAALGGWPIQLAVESGWATARFWDEPASELRDAAAKSAGGGRYRFHPMGADCRLFAVPRVYRGIDCPFDPALDAPLALTMAADERLLDRALEIAIEGADGAFHAIPSAEMALADLSTWELPAGTTARVCLDPLLGRFILTTPAARDPRALVRFAYAASGDVGGGPYERTMTEPGESTWIARVHHEALPGSGVYRTLAEALAAFRGVADHGLIRILDSGAYDLDERAASEPATVCQTDPNAPRRLTIEALSGETPVLRGTLGFEGGASGLRLVLGGLWIDGQVVIGEGVEARIEHCSIHPLSAQRLSGTAMTGLAAIELASGDASGDRAPARLILHACLTGPLAVGPRTALAISDSVIDGRRGGMAIAGDPAATIERCTILGGAAFGALGAANSIFASPVTVAGRDCALRNCFVSAGSDLPGALQCLSGPDPISGSSVFAMPGYARLAPAAGEEIRTGASNGSEIGVFNAGHAAQRLALMEDCLTTRLPIGIGSQTERQR